MFALSGLASVWLAFALSPESVTPAAPFSFASDLIMLVLILTGAVN